MHSVALLEQVSRLYFTLNIFCHLAYLSCSKSNKLKVLGIVPMYNRRDKNLHTGSATAAMKYNKQCFQ